MTSEPPKSESTSPPSRKRVDPLVGTVLDGRFEIEEVLGSGGMSVVYKANQLRVNRHVAVKTLRMQLDSKPIYRERFQNEINLLCALSHPNIVTVYDCVIGPDDQPYVIMDYLRGRSLEVLIGQEGPISVERFMRIAVQVCGALDHAHRKGVIHRDLKPGNIVLMDDESDFVKVVDFGLAKLNDTNRRLTQSGELWGSPPYMSPEHCQSKPEDERSDLYSFGCVMYEMLTGKDPFHFATSVYELIQIHINTQPPSLAEANPLVHVPAELETVIFKAMAKLPEDRYQTAAELRDALVAVSSGMGRHSGDLLALPTAGKRSNSTGEIIPAPGAANFTPAEPNRSTSPSEHFRRALDPMRGINVDQLFDGTADSAEFSSRNTAGPGSARTENSTQPDIISKPANSNHSSTAADSDSAVKHAKPPAGMPPQAGSNIRRMQSETQKPLLPAMLAGALLGAGMIVAFIFAVPQFMHKTPGDKSATDSTSVPKGAEDPAIHTAPALHSTSALHSTTAGQPKTDAPPAAALSNPAMISNTTAGSHPTPGIHPAAGSRPAAVPHATAMSHPTASRPAAAHTPASHPAAISHTATNQRSAATHATPSSAKSSNPWDALQGLRKGK